MSRSDPLLAVTDNTGGCCRLSKELLHGTDEVWIWMEDLRPGDVVYYTRYSQHSHDPWGDLGFPLTCLWIDHPATDPRWRRPGLDPSGIPILTNNRARFLNNEGSVKTLIWDDGEIKALVGR